MRFWLALLACSGTSPTGDDPYTDLTTDTGPDGPWIQAVGLATPTDAAPLVRSLTVKTEVPTTLSVSWTDGEHTVTVDFPELATEHDHLLLGFRPGRTYTLTVTATDEDGRRSTHEDEVQTVAVPAHFPRVELTVPDPGAVQPGHTLVPLRVPDPGVGTPSELALVFDEQGEICFWLDTGELLQDVIETGDGGLLTLLDYQFPRAVRFGWDGLQTDAWTIGAGPEATPIDAALGGNLHHDVGEVPGQPGRYLALSRHPIQVPDWPASYTDPAQRGPRTVADDVVLDFDADGSVNAEIPLSSLVPVQRIGYDSLGTTVEGWADWAHANAVIWDDGDYVVSLRHQDAVLKIAAEGSVAWILGPPGGWPPELEAKRLQPSGDLRWPFHAHAPRFAPDGPMGERRLVLFDNGNWQALPFSGVDPIDPALQRSRVVQFSIDEATRGVRQDWSYEQSTVAGGPLFSEAVGDADPLTNGHVLAVFGMLSSLPDGRSNEAAGLGRRSVRIVEFDPATLQDVWHLYLSTDTADNDAGWSAYRAQRIESLYGRADL